MARHRSRSALTLTLAPHLPLALAPSACGAAYEPKRPVGPSAAPEKKEEGASSRRMPGGRCGEMQGDIGRYREV